MAELSKTAKKAMAAGENNPNQPKKAHVWTNDEMIHQIRISRPPNANLFVGNMLFTDALLQEYDKAVASQTALVAAVTKIYGAAFWRADRPVDDAAGLWEALRAAAGLPKGTSPVEIPAEYTGQQEHSEI